MLPLKAWPIAASAIGYGKPCLTSLPFSSTSQEEACNAIPRTAIATGVLPDGELPDPSGIAADSLAETEVSGQQVSLTDTRTIQASAVAMTPAGLASISMVYTC